MANKKNILQQFGDFGAVFTGLDATPTGTDPSADVVADFTGATSGTLSGIPSFNPALPPVLHTPSQTLGSTFKINAWGIWQACAWVQAQTAASVLAAINLDGIAADLNADPVQIAAAPARQMGRGLWIGAAAGDSSPIALSSRQFIITKRMAQTASLGIVRLLLSNNAGAGAAAASLLLASCSFGLVRVGEIPAHLAER